MIGRLMTYPYAGARSRGLASSLFTPAELMELAGSESRDEAADRLKRRTSRAARDSVERRLQEDYLRFGRLILRTLPAPGADLLRAYLARNWVENLLVLCRGLLASRSGEAVLLPVLEGPALPEPGEVSSLSELEALLPPGSYREVLQKHRSDAERGGPALLENRLIRNYWAEVAERVARLPAADRAAAGEILALRADIDALRCLSRGGQDGLEPAEILAAWPPLSRLLDQERLRRGLRSESPEQILQRLQDRGLSAAADDAAGAEPLLRRRLRRALRRWLRSAPLDLSIPLSALLLKELEVGDLAGVLGGLRFGLDRERIGAALAGGRD